MCLAIPGKIIHRDGLNATVDVSGAQVAARLDFVEEAAVGDYVLVHAGFAISRVDEQEAHETLRLYAELKRAEREVAAVGR